jgi:hypothetical protein
MSLLASGHGSSRGISPDLCGSLVIVIVNRMISHVLINVVRGSFPYFSS